MDVHILPVGFDRDRLVAPLGRGGMPVDRVLLLHAKTADARTPWGALTTRLLANVKRDLTVVAGLTPDQIEEHELPGLHSYHDLYAKASSLLVDILQAPGEPCVHVNVSSMPRTVSFAFAAAVAQLPVAMPEARGRLHLYYVPAADYLMNGLLSGLQRLVQEGRTVSGPPSFDAALDAATELLEDAQAYGQTKGARVDAATGKCWVTLPVQFPGELREVERRLLDMLFHRSDFASVSELAASLAVEDAQNVLHVKSTVIYNVTALHEKGLVALHQDGRRMAPSLTGAGRLLAQSLEYSHPHQ